MDIEGYAADGSDGEGDTRVRTGGSDRDRKQRMDKLFGQYRDRSARATSDLLAGAPVAAEFRSEVRLAVQQLLQNMIDGSRTRHHCFKHGLTDEPPTVERTFPMIVQDLSAWYDVDVPTLKCSLCGLWDVQAEECCCFPASPTEPRLWFLTPVLNFYDELLLNGGQSAEGACAASRSC